eukprot:scaffold7381_cov310-Pinguiococcus_pyrenoidosus.AAC.129
MREETPSGTIPHDPNLERRLLRRGPRSRGAWRRRRCARLDPDDVLQQTRPLQPPSALYWAVRAGEVGLVLARHDLLNRTNEVALCRVGAQHADVGTLLSQIRKRRLGLLIGVVSDKVQIEAIAEARQIPLRRHVVVFVGMEGRRLAPVLQVLQKLHACRPRLNLAEVDVPEAEACQRLVQSARSVWQREDDARLVRHLSPSLRPSSRDEVIDRLPRQQHEAGEV